MKKHIKTYTTAQLPLVRSKTVRTLMSNNVEMNFSTIQNRGGKTIVIVDAKLNLSWEPYRFQVAFVLENKKDFDRLLRENILKAICGLNTDTLGTARMNDNDWELSFDEILTYAKDGETKFGKIYDELKALENESQSVAA